MTPTLSPGDKIFFESLAHCSIKPGDILLFQPPDRSYEVVHRVISIRRGIILTRGDNPSNTLDNWRLSEEHIIGRVTGVERKNRIVNLAQGRRGLGRHYCLHISRLLFIRQPFRRALKLFYQTSAKSINLDRLLSLSSRTTILRLKINDDWHWKIFLGKKVIGYKKGADQPWNIIFPYRFFIRKRMLDRIDYKG